jgi:hypothetical protein
MNINFPAPLDGTKALAIDIHTRELALPEDRGQHVRRTVEAFEALAADGGLVYYLDRNRFPERALDGLLSWRQGGFVYSPGYFPYGDRGLALLLRMFRRLATLGIHIDTVQVHGTRARVVDGSAIVSVATELETLPERMRKIPFELEICPSGAWVNLQCDLLSGDSDAIAATFDTKIRNWVEVVLLGGFHIVSAHTSIEDEFGISVSRPSVAEDFVEWHIQMPDVPLESLNCLLNVFASYSQQFPVIRTVYMG